MRMKMLKSVSGEKNSLTKTIAFIAFLVLSGGFVFSCYKRVTWEFFLAYPAGVMIVYIPQMVIRFFGQLECLIRAWKGGGNDDNTIPSH